MLTLYDIHVERTDRKLRMYWALGHVATGALGMLVIAVMLAGCGKKQEQSYSVQSTPVSAPVGKLGGI